MGLSHPPWSSTHQKKCLDEVSLPTKTCQYWYEVFLFDRNWVPWRQSSHRSLRLGSQGLQTYERNSSCSKSRHPYLQCSSASLICSSYTSQNTFKQPSLWKEMRVRSVTDRSRCLLFQYSSHSSYRWHTWTIFWSVSPSFNFLPLVIRFPLRWHSFVVEYFSIAPT